MTADDAEVQSTWKDLGTVVAELRRIQHSALADRLVECVRYASTSGEIYDGVGVALAEHRALRRRLGDVGAAAWDRVMDDVDRACGVRLGGWLARRWRRLWRRA